MQQEHPQLFREYGNNFYAARDTRHTQHFESEAAMLGEPDEAVTMFGRGCIVPTDTCQETVSAGDIRIAITLLPERKGLFGSRVGEVLATILMEAVLFERQTSVVTGRHLIDSTERAFKITEGEKMRRFQQQIAWEKNYAAQTAGTPPTATLYEILLPGRRKSSEADSCYRRFRLSDIQLQEQGICLKVMANSQHPQMDLLRAPDLPTPSLEVSPVSLGPTIAFDLSEGSFFWLITPDTNALIQREQQIRSLRQARQK